MANPVWFPLAEAGETDRLTDRQKDRQTKRKKEGDKETDSQSQSQRQEETDRDRQRQAGTDREMQTDMICDPVGKTRVHDRWASFQLAHSFNDDCTQTA